MFNGIRFHVSEAMHDLSELIDEAAYRIAPVIDDGFFPDVPEDVIAREVARIASSEDSLAKALYLEACKPK